MFVRTDWARRVSLAGILLITSGGCADKGITDPATLGPSYAKNGPKDRSDSGFVLNDLGFPPWADDASALAVNDAGQAVGQSLGSGGQDPRGFFWAGDWTALSETGVTSSGRAISNGSTVYVGGHLEHGGTSRPTRWTVSTSGGTPTLSVEILDYSAFGQVRGVNDHGTAVGVSGCIVGCLGHAAIWPLAGSPTALDPPPAAGFTSGTARDINNAGLVALVFTHPDFSRAYLRLADGTLVELQPRSGDVSSFAGGLSEVGSDGTVFVAGTTFRTDSDFHPVRWRVHASNGVVLSVEVLSDNGSVGSTSAVGELAGSIEKRQTDRAAVWPASSAVELPRPKGTSLSTAWSISPSGEYVAGHVTARLSSRRAVLWSRKP